MTRFLGARGDSSGTTGTAFPSALALAVTFDVSLGATCFGLVSNLVKDSRWGHTNEMITGECPQLGKVMSHAFTMGIQAQPYNTRTGKRIMTTVANHLNAHCGPEGCGYTFDTHTKRFNVHHD
eukprot:m.1367202 g.1367202  ORF g.1367202 m.1367202 type:complete len:123 (+) comp24952_c0_seq75:802-1170(+)